MAKPNLSTVPQFYRGYVEEVPYDDLIPGLIQSIDETTTLIRSIHENHGEHRYTEGKWSIKEVLAHMIDAERVFSYRAMRFARNDSSPLSGFDENAYTPESNTKDRKMHKIADELVNLRATTVDLFGSFSQEMLSRTGVASGVEMSVSMIGFIIIGHETHHREIIRTRYL